MDDEGSGSEFQDWELLHEFEFESDHSPPQLVSSNFPDSNSNTSFFQLIHGDSASSTTICLDYFSLPNHEDTNAKEVSLVESENRNCRRSTSELGSESLDDIAKSVTGFEEIVTDVENLERRKSDDGKFSGSAFVARDEPLSAKDVYSPMEFEDSGEETEIRDEILDQSCPNSTANESVAMKSGYDGEENDDIESVNDISNKDLGGEDGDSSEKPVEFQIMHINATMSLTNGGYIS